MPDGVNTFTIPEPKRFNRRYLRHILRSAPATATPSQSTSPRLTVQETPAYFFGPAEELVLDPELPRKCAAFDQAVQAICAHGLPGRKLERVVFVVNAWQRVGGVLSVAQLANDLVEAGVDVTIVALSPNGYCGDIESRTEPVFFKSRRDFVRHFPDADVVVSTLWSTVYHVMHAFLHRPDFVPAYFVQDFEPLFYPPEDDVTREHVRRTYRMMPHAFTKTAWLARRVEDCGGRARVVPPAVDLGRFSPAGEPANVRPSVLAMLRPSTPRRSAGDAVTVLRQLAQRMPAAAIHTFGCTAPDLESLGVDFKIIHHGVLPNDALPELYRSASVYLDCSSFHGFGRTVAEAFACGTPCVVTRSGGVEDFCRHEHNCLMADPGDIDSLVDALHRVLIDSALHGRLASNARPSVKAFDRSHSSNETLRFFRRIVEGGETA